MSKIYEKIRKIRGKPPRNIKILTFDNRIYSTVQDIVNLLAESFLRVSSETNYSDRFRQHKEVEERTNLDFSSDNTEEYNALFTMAELQHALSSCGNTSPGPDKIHYLILKNLPPNAHFFLLHMYNTMWIQSFFPYEWGNATIIPIPEPQKDDSNPNNYRPIALTSCLCKVLEKLINGRLLEYLENNKHISSFQNGFWKNRSTIDHLVRLETYIRRRMTDNKLTISVFRSEKSL